MKTLTAHQRHVLDYIRDFQQRNRYSPSISDIAFAFGYRSKTSALNIVIRLAAADALRLSPTGRICFATTPVRANAVRLPLVTSGRCYLSLHVPQA